MTSILRISDTDPMEVEQDLVEAMVDWADDPVAFVREVLGVEPDEWQLDGLREVAGNERVAMCACKGPGKAQPKSVVIDTPTGPRTFGSLMVGDVVFAADGSPAKVQAVHRRGVLPVYRVAFDDGSSTLCCGEHLWRVRGRTERRRGRWSVLNTEQIIARGVREKNGRWRTRQFEIPRQGAAAYPRASLPLDPYVLGVWLGDGCRRNGNYATKTTPEIENRIESRGHVVCRYERSATLPGVRPALRELGVLDLYSYERFVPERYRHASIEQRRELLQGLMDTDGAIGSDGHMEFASTSKRLAEDVVWLVRSLGGAAWLKEAIKQPFYYREDGERVDCRPCYRATVVLPFNPFSAPHRAERWRQPQVRYLTRYIDSIEPAGTADCVCIEIDDPSKCYLTNDFIVTHNSCLLAWVIWWFLATREDAEVMALSITEDNLRDNLWKELGIWQARSEFLRATFELRAKRIVCKERPKTWWCSARAFAQQADPTAQANTLAGFHGSHIMVVLDEVGDYPDGVVVAADGIFANDQIEAKLVAAGNPTSTKGPLYRITTRDRRLWRVINITGDPEDPKRSPRISRRWAEDHIRQWGRDNPWVMVNVLGLFPPAGADELISANDVMLAQRRDARPADFRSDAKVWGLDPARFGDDEACLARRQGIVCFPFTVWRSLDGPQLAAQVGQLLLAAERLGKLPDALFVDVGGVGSSAYDHLMLLGWGHIIQAVDFGGTPTDARFLNKRAEMWWAMAEWTKRRPCCLPTDPMLADEMTAPTYEYRVVNKRTCFALEAKEKMRKRGIASPSRADALALTFAGPVAPKSKDFELARRHTRRAETNYDPYTRDANPAGRAVTEYDPLHPRF